MDIRDALRNIKQLADIVDSDNIALARDHLEMIRQIATTALSPDAPQPPPDDPHSRRWKQ